MALKSALAYFSAQQAPRSAIRVSELENKLRKLNTTEYWQRRGRNNGIVCNVVNLLGFPVSKDGECVLEVQSSPASSSSEHLVLFANLHIKEAGGKDDIVTREVVIKFRYIDVGGVQHVQNMDNVHCESIIKNYNDLHRYVSELSVNGMIDVVPVCILRGTATYEDPFLRGINLWVEKKVYGFTKFTNNFSPRRRIVVEGEP
jgi:hypothetical protein